MGKRLAGMLAVALCCGCLFGCQETAESDTAEQGQRTSAAEPAVSDRGAASNANSDVASDASKAEAYGELQAQVGELVAAVPFDVGVAYVDLSAPSGQAGFQVSGDMRLVSASMIKLVVLAEFLDEVGRGMLSMEEPYTIQASDIVGGTGSIQSAGAGTTYALADLAHLMISESDNVAANVLIRTMGMDAVNAQAAKLGLKQTQMNRLMMDEAAIANHVENFMSAEDVARVLALIWQGELVSPEASAFALQALEAQADSSGIAAGLPSGVTFAHKTGTLTLVKNDGGIVEAERPYVLAVMCSGGDESSELALMAQISEMVYGISQV